MVLADAMAWLAAKSPLAVSFGLLDGAAHVRALRQSARGGGAQICFPDARIHGGACLFDSIGHNQLPSIL